MSAVLGYCPPEFATEIDLDLSKNEGRSPRPGCLAQDFAVETERYPSLDALRDDLARLYGVAPDRLLVTAGGDDALLRLCLLALDTGANALVATPTFEMIRRYVALARGELREVPWAEGAFPTEQLLAAADAQTSLVFVVSPNNPTGAVASSRDLEQIAARLPNALIVLDAAYAEFADVDLMPCALRLPNVVVVRTLSKAWGLAGLRVGCAIAAPELVARLFAAGNPMPVSIASAAMARHRLRTGAQDVADYVELVRAQRLALARTLSDLGAQPAEPCQGNFVLARGVDSEWTTAALASVGIAVRRFPDRPDLVDACRITLPGTAAAYARLESGVVAALAPQAVLFDMDGVLADVRESYRRAIVATAESYGVPVTQADIAAAKLRGNANDDWELTRTLLRERGVEIPLAEVVDRFEAFYLDLRDREQLMVRSELLARWARRLPLAVVTGRPRAQAEFFLRQFGLEDHFATVVCREDAPGKPDPAPVRLALQQLGVSSAWMLGDTVDDMRAARAAGVVPIAVGSGVPENLAARVLATTEDLEALL